MNSAPNQIYPNLSRCLSVDLEVTKQDHRIRAFAGVRWDTGQSFIFPGTGDRLAQALAKLDDLALDADFLLGHSFISFDRTRLQAVVPAIGQLGLLNAVWSDWA